MQKLSRFEQAIYEASIRELDSDVFKFILEYIELLINKQPIPKYPIVLLLLSYLYLLIPSLKDRFYSKESWGLLPFGMDLSSVEEIKNGNTKIVFKIKLRNGKWYVLKISKASIGLSQHDLSSCVFSDKSEYSEVLDWYSDLNIVHPTSYLIVNSPFRGVPAAVSIQEWIDEKVVDIFDFVNCPEELYKAAKLNLDFRQKLIEFCKRTISLFDLQKRSLDILGSKNIVVLQDRFGNFDLKIIDSESLIFYDLNALRSSELERVFERINLLRDVVSRFQEG